MIYAQLTKKRLGLALPIYITRDCLLEVTHPLLCLKNQDGTPDQDIVIYPDDSIEQMIQQEINRLTKAYKYYNTRSDSLADFNRKIDSFVLQAVQLCNDKYYINIKSAQDIYDLVADKKYTGTEQWREISDKLKSGDYPDSVKLNLCEELQKILGGPQPTPSF